MKVTKNKYFIKSDFGCNTVTALGLITYRKCSNQIVESASNNEIRFRIHKRNINTSDDQY